VGDKGADGTWLSCYALCWVMLCMCLCGGLGLGTALATLGKQQVHCLYAMV
jgi:hypothetical protein